MVSRVIPVDPFDLVIFGATGDLARRKILPGLFRRYCSGQMPEDARIIGAARSDMDTAGFREMVAEATREFGGGRHCEDGTLEQFLERIDYEAVDAMGEGGWEALKTHLRPGTVRAFYFSVGPALFGALAERLRHFGLADDDSRVVVEKPFGHHYLGKETVQNLMAVRFGNMLFEPLWNAQYVDHIQITVAETVDVGGRGGYYDKSGAMRDMVQNHLMQLLCLIAMEPPARFEPDSVRDEKLKVIRALDPVDYHHIVRGQYDADDDQPGYRAHVENPRSTTESFVAMKCHISNWRWAGTPFYLRTGKKLRARASEIAVVFKDAPHSIFGPEAGTHRNVLAIRLQPNEGMTLGVTIKEPGPGGMRLVDVPLDMSFAEALGPEAEEVPDAYERLIMDVIRGNQTLFMRGDEVEAAWLGRGEVPKPYDPGSAGPDDALMLMHRDGRRWRDIRA